MDIYNKVPWWLLHPLPANAVIDKKLHASIEDLAASLTENPEHIELLDDDLAAIKAFAEYDAAANLACAHVWLILEKFYAAEDDGAVRGLLAFAKNHMPEKAQARIFRRLVKHRSS